MKVARDAVLSAVGDLAHDLMGQGELLEDWLSDGVGYDSATENLEAEFRGILIFLEQHFDDNPIPR